MEIYLRYGPAVLRKCERILGNRTDAEDIVQGLFTDILKSGVPDESLAYLFRAATNRCLNFIRDRKRRSALLDRHRSDPSLLNRRYCLEDRTVDLELLTKLVAKLNKETASILVYRYIDDMSQEEICEMTGLSRKTVAKRLNEIERVAKKLLSREKGDRP